MADQGDVAAQLLDLAREDLAAARALEEAEGISASKSGFNAQQAVEKSLKAALAGLGEDCPFTHDIALLIELCEDHGLQLPDELREADRLTPYAAALRYGLGDPAVVASDEAIRWAARAIEWAGSQIRRSSD
jgi:HEPN domain-containing protein